MRLTIGVISIARFSRSPARFRLAGRSIRVASRSSIPTVFYALSLKSELSARGIAVSGAAVDFDDVAAEFVPTNSTTDHDGNGTASAVIAKTESPPLRDIATVLMKVSQNLYAETLLKAVGGAQNGLGTTEGGRIVARTTLSDWGIKTIRYVMYDGSGLSRYNYLTASAVVDVLLHMYKDPRHRDAFLATLPIAGKDGTIATRMQRYSRRRERRRENGFNL